MLEFLTKEKVHTGFGMDISEAHTMEEALQIGGLNWTVQPTPAYHYSAQRGLQEVPNTFVNTRVEDGKALGVVSGKYRICQNREAFDFLDNLLEDGSLHLLRAGSFRGGRSVWIQGQIDGDEEVLGEQVGKYILFTNTHDGTGSIRALFTPKRLICSNAINIAIRAAQRSWSCTHTGKLDEKLLVARQTLLMSEKYMQALKSEANVLSNISITYVDMEGLLEQLVPEGESDRSKELAHQVRQRIREVYNLKPDLQVLPNNGYRFINAVSDYATHAEPFRRASTYDERLFEQTAKGHPMLDKAYSLVKELA